MPLPAPPPLPSPPSPLLLPSPMPLPAPPPSFPLLPPSTLSEPASEPFVTAVASAFSLPLLPNSSYDARGASATAPTVAAPPSPPPPPLSSSLPLPSPSPPLLSLSLSLASSAALLSDESFTLLLAVTAFINAFVTVTASILIAASSFFVMSWKWSFPLSRLSCRSVTTLRFLDSRPCGVK